MKNSTPFLEVQSFAEEEVSRSIPEPSGPPSSPFLAVYETGDTGDLIDPQTDNYVVFLNELYDDEFEEALFTLASEATALHEEWFQHEHGEPRVMAHEAERLLIQHFAPLVAEAHTMLDSFAREFGQRDPYSLTQDEIAVVLKRYQPSQELVPSFEEFLGKLKKVVSKVAGTAVDLAKKGAGAAARAGLGPVLERLKALVKPLLQRVVQTAIGRLPAQLQPHARRLAERLPLLKEIEEGDEPLSAIGETCEVARIQYEFNHRVANLLFASTEVELELEVARLAAEQSSMPDHYPLAELDLARNRFVEKLGRLREGEDPTPHVEEFIPAILPALQLGIRLAGRKRVVDFLAGLVGKLIERFVGPQHTPALSQAIVDAGLRMIQLEAGPEDASQAAASAVVATIEETVRRVADLPDHVLDDEELFEGFALRAFEQAAASNLPPVLPESTYRKRPDLTEARSLNGTWVMMPQGRRKRYKKFSRKLTTRLSPHKVASLESFEGIPLEEFLEEELGVPLGEELEAVVHLYESIAGTHLPDIARLDDAPGLAVQDGYEQLHPLTPTAAGVLLGEPELGREVDPRYLVDEHTTAVGQRFYFLEVPGRRPLGVPHASGKVRTRRPTQLRLVFDFPKNEIRVRLFLSEIRAQEVAVKLRQHSHVGAVVAQLQRYVDRGLRSSLTGAFARLKLVHETVTPDMWVPALRRLPSIVPQLLRSRLQEWVLTALADHLKRHPEDFVQAANDTADGVTLLLTIGTPPGFPQLRQALKGKALSLTDLKLPGAKPSVKVQTLPGHADE
jgi:hypothetical protein